jgi:site-specific recombinase XerD
MPKISKRVTDAAQRSLGLHGLRHSIASHLAMGGAQAAQIMAAMGHRQLSTVQRYIHFAEDKRHSLAEQAALVALAGMAASGSQLMSEGDEAQGKKR